MYLCRYLFNTKPDTNHNANLTDPNSTIHGSNPTILLSIVVNYKTL